MAVGGELAVLSWKDPYYDIDVGGEDEGPIMDPSAKEAQCCECKGSTKQVSERKKCYCYYYYFLFSC